jgi:putative peptide zinc metalloprotease protein
MPEQVFDYLPPLREDLGLFPGPVLQDGSPSWTIHDPVRNRYHRIGREAFDMLRHWHVGSAKKLLATLRDTAVSPPTLEEVEWMANFLHANMLVQRKSADDIAGLMRIAQASKSSW